MAEEGQFSVNVDALSFDVLKKIRGYLRRMVDAGGSDLHVKANGVVRARINGDIVPLSGEIFSKEDALTFAKVVDLPLPVTPVTKTSPRSISAKLWTISGKLSSSMVKILTGMRRKTADIPSI